MLFGVALLWCSPIYSQDGSGSIATEDSLALQSVVDPLLRKFDEGAMEAYKEQREFDYSTELAAGPSWFSIFLLWVMSQLATFFNTPNTEWLVDNFFNLLFIVGIIIGVILIIRMRFGTVIVGSGERGIKAPIVPELEEQDYEQLLQQALNANDLKLASRYLYIQTLQALHKKGIVKLMKWKTVLEYTEEIPSEKRPFFQKIGLLFESTWYGNYEPTEQDFEEGIASSKQLVS